MKKHFFPIALVAFIIGLSFISCDKKNNVTDLPNDTINVYNDSVAQANAKIKKVIKFIHDDMTDYYLWTSNMPAIDYTKETDPETYFNKLLFKPDDHFSFMTDDYDALFNSLQGTEKSFGYSLTFSNLANRNFAIIEYVNPNTPASEAGLKRGDIILKINGRDITSVNYESLFYSESVNITLADLTEGGLVEKNTITMAGKELTMNPVLVRKVMEFEGKKIGYMVYNQFIAGFDSAVNNTLQYFNSQNVTELVLDLRFNPGGYQSSAINFCSSIAPQANVSNGDVLISLQWNDLLTEVWQSSDEYKDQLIVNFDKQPTSRLNINRLYVLTSKGTASASELLICGLKAYMPVTLVGSTTYGKYTGSITLQPEVQINNKWVVDQTIKNWAIQPIVMKYANARGVTDFKNGFEPDEYVVDQLTPAYQLGDPAEPLLKKAIEKILGHPPVLALKSNKTNLPEYQIIGRASSRFEQFHRNLLVDMPKIRRN